MDGPHVGPAHPGMVSICADLAAEQASLDDIVSELDEHGWEAPTPAEGWAVRDQISHLAYSEDLAALAAGDAEAFHQEMARLIEDVVRAASEPVERGRSMSPEALLSWWREARRKTLDALSQLDPRSRVPWAGPDMSAVSLATARLMETWAHGQDVADALGVRRPATRRLRHVAHLGVITRGWSYTVRGMAAPEASVGVQLSGPNGERWDWGDAAAAQRVSGSALDFCLVTTQRRHVSDTDLVVEGVAAAEWLSIAQAFAGPPGAGRTPGQFK